MKPDDIERRFATGECIVEPGSQERALFVIRSGEVRVDPGAGDAPYLLGPGDLFGEFAAILGQPHADRASADSDVCLLALDAGLLNRLCAENGEIAARLIRHLARRAAGGERPRPLERRASEAEVLQRVAEVILERAPDPEGPVPVSGKLVDLAGHAGVSPREAYGALQRLIDERVLRLTDDQLTLLQPDELRARLRTGES